MFIFKGQIQYVSLCRWKLCLCRVLWMKTVLEQRGVCVSQKAVYRVMSEMEFFHRRRTARATTKATMGIQDCKKRSRVTLWQKNASKLYPTYLRHTEIRCHDDKLYLAGCSTATTVRTFPWRWITIWKELCIRTITELELQYGKKKLAGAIFHGDRRSQ